MALTDRLTGASSGAAVFPAFWIFGAMMLIKPLRSPDTRSSHSVWPPNGAFLRWCSENIQTEEDRIEFMAQFHAGEMKWAKRCLLATFVLVCLAIAVGATVFGVTKVTGNTKPASS